MADTITTTLRKALQTKLKALCSDVSYRVSRGNHSGLFVVYGLSSVDEETVSQMTLTVDVLGRGQNTTGVDALADQICEALDHWYYLDTTTDIGFTSYQQSRSPIEEDEDTLTHWRLVFLVRLYK